MKGECRILPIFLPNQGCPSRCVFCDQSITAGTAPTRLTPLSLISWVEETERLLERNHPGEFLMPPEIAFFGATFTGLPLEEQAAWLVAANTLVQRGEAKSIRISTRPDHLDQPTILRVMSLGVSTVELGIQSFSTPVLRLAGRNYDSQAAEDAVLRLQQAGCHVVVQLMPFMPGSREEDDLKSAQLVAKLKTDGVRLFPTLVLRGTKLQEWYLNGDYVPPGLAETAQRCGAMMVPMLQAGVKVLRVGLQDSDTLRANLVAGPHHPALGELAWSTVAALMLAESFVKLGPEKVPPRVTVSGRAASLMLGHTGFGRRYLSGLLGCPVGVEMLESAVHAPGGTDQSLPFVGVSSSLLVALGDLMVLGNKHWLHLSRRGRDADSSLENLEETQ